MTGRRKNPSALPARVYEKHGSWWYVDAKRKWHKLCRVSQGISDLYCELSKFSRSLDGPRADTMPSVVDDWILHRLPKYAVATRAEYARMAQKIKSEFDDEWTIGDVRPVDIARFLDRHFQGKPNASNKYRALLSIIFAFAIRRGQCDRNPVREVEGATEAKRDRYISDDELSAIRAAARLGEDGRITTSGETIVALIDLAYQTAQRIGDLLSLNWQAVSEEGIYFRPSKTVNSSGVRMLIEMTSDLRATLDKAKAGRVKAIGPVICTQSGGRYTYSGAQTAWKRACKRALKRYRDLCQANGIEADPRYLTEMHFHDLRAKALTDKRRVHGADSAQALAGHTTAEMTAHYTKAREVERVKPVPMNHQRMTVG